MKTFVINSMKLIAGLMPKKKNLWLFGAWEGKSYADNAKYMFEYVVKNHPEIDAIWLTKSSLVEKNLLAKNMKCHNKWSIKGIWYALRAEVAFETEGDGDVSSFMNGTLIIQLWHGMGAKAMNWKQKDDFVLFDKFVRKRREDTYWMATSELYISTLSMLTGTPSDHFIITGYPRNDMLIEKPTCSYMESFIKEHPNSKVIIYMPTHRNFGKDGNGTINVSNLKLVDSFLASRNIYMFYKPHIHELENFNKVENDFNNIVFAKDQSVFADPYEYLHYFDLLISDYSSVMTDFACANKPIVVFPYDIENYKNSDSGLLSYYYSILVGPFCYTWGEVMESVETQLSKDIWEKERNKSRSIYHFYNDGKNRDRVYEAVKEILNQKRRKNG